ncbi:MAG: glycosyltransferase family 9 protein [Candidatus Zixiibacteriota bacterium]
MGSDRLKPFEHWFKALFFKLFRRSLRRRRDGFTPLDGDKLRKVLFLRPEKIGDMVISLPVFDGLKNRYPDLRISILASPRNLALIDNDPRFDRIFLYRKNLWRDLRELIHIRRERFDCVVDMICDDSVTALFLTQLAAPGRPRIGVGKVKFRDYYDFNYDHRRGNTGHIIENTLKLLDAFGINSSSVTGYAAPYLEKEALDAAERFFRRVRDGAPNACVVGYNMSAGAPTRIWAEEKSVELVRRILGSDQACTVILFVIPSDRERGRRLQRQFPERVRLLPDGLDLPGASALISKLDMLISPDTSLVHIARSLRVPVVGLYSRYLKNFLLWRPYDQEVGAVISNNDDNIFDITVADVFETFLKVRNKTAPVR